MELFMENLDNIGFVCGDLWSIQTELEQDRDRELNQYKWVLRYYVILSHCNEQDWEWGWELREWVSNPFCNLPGDLTGELMVSCTISMYISFWSQSPSCCSVKGLA